MSFQPTVPCFLSFYRSDRSLLFFKFKIFVLNASLLAQVAYNQVQPLQINYLTS